MKTKIQRRKVSCPRSLTNSRERPGLKRKSSFLYIRRILWVKATESETSGHGACVDTVTPDGRVQLNRHQTSHPLDNEALEPVRLASMSHVGFFPWCCEQPEEFRNLESNLRLPSSELPGFSVLSFHFLIWKGGNSASQGGSKEPV